jgi:carboxymethylenebutenolidase
VLVIHEGYGLVEHIRDVARRFANVGLNALAPNLYTRIGTPNMADLDAVMHTMLSLDDQDVVADLEAGIEFLGSRPESTDRIGSIGFCSGGRQSLLLACSSAKLSAAVDCWGGFIRRANRNEVVNVLRPTPVIDLVDRIACPVLVVGGVEDTNPSPDDLTELERRLKVGGKRTEVRIFDDAGHAFFADYRPNYRPEAAFRLWPVLVDFFRTHLG